MKVFILILWINQGYGTAMTTQEFYNIESCQAAGAVWLHQVMQTAKISDRHEFVCVEK